VWPGAKGEGKPGEQGADRQKPGHAVLSGDLLHMVFIRVFRATIGMVPGRCAHQVKVEGM
jgi:hypothetical protein